MTREELYRYFELYESFHDLDAFETAFNGYVRLVEEHPDDADALWTLGVLNDYRSKDYLREAVRLIKLAQIKAKEQGNEMIYRKTSYQLIGLYSRNNEIHKAIEEHKKQLREQSDEIENYAFLIHAYLTAGQPHDAQKVCAAGLKLDAEDPILNYYAGEIALDLGRFDEAFAFWRKAVALDPDLGDPRYSIAFLYRRLGKNEEAAKAFSELSDWLLSKGWDIEAKWALAEKSKL